MIRAAALLAGAWVVASAAAPAALAQAQPDPGTPNRGRIEAQNHGRAPGQTTSGATEPHPALPAERATAKATMAVAPGAAPALPTASVSCSAEADAKNLHGKARKTFRNRCEAAHKPR